MAALLVEDDELAESCRTFLREHGATEFANVEAVKQAFNIPDELFKGA